MSALEEFTNERKRAINMTRTDQRFDVSLKGTFQMKELYYPVNVIDISSGGARIYFNTRFEYVYAKSVSLSFTAEDNGQLTFEFFPVWMNG